MKDAPVPTILTVFSLGLSFLAGACLFSASQREWVPEPWPEGRFELRATAEDVTVSGNLYIDRDGVMTFSTTAGTCQHRTPSEEARDRTRNQRTFRCGSASFILRPRGSTLMGEALVPITVTVRGNPVCIAYNENRQCIEYESSETFRDVTRRVRLTVIRGVAP